MDFNVIKDAAQILATGGPVAITLILSIVIVWLVKDRRDLISRIDKKDEQVLSIIKQYYEGSLNVAQALGKIQEVLAAMREKIR